MNKEITVGAKLTLFWISDFVATCFRNEVIVKAVKGNIVTMVELKKRKPFARDISKDSILLLEGHNLNIKADSETGSFWGNGCFNLVGESPEKVIAILEEKTMKEITPAQREEITFKSFDAPDDNEGKVEYLFRTPETV